MNKWKISCEKNPKNRSQKYPSTVIYEINHRIKSVTLHSTAQTILLNQRAYRKQEKINQ